MFKCLPCPNGCYDCGLYGRCSSCNYGYVLQEYYCVRCKPDFYYSSSICEKKCSGNCLASCPNGTFKNNSNYTCDSCNSKCQTCDNDT